MGCDPRFALAGLRMARRYPPREEIMRKLLLMAAVASLMAAAAAVGSAKADYGKAQYQITFSSNCNNATFCGNGLGGDWGWAALNADGTGDLVTTGCGHFPGFGGGAFNEHVDIYQWSIDTVTGYFRIDSASDPSFEGDTPIPYEPGNSYHFSFRPAPGVNVEGQVTQIVSR
jgi:hypothetical protein